VAVAVEMLDNTVTGMSDPEHAPSGDQTLFLPLVPYAMLSHSSRLKQRALQDSTLSSSLDPDLSKVLKLGSPKHVENLQPIYAISSETCFPILITVAISNPASLPPH